MGYSEIYLCCLYFPHWNPPTYYKMFFFFFLKNRPWLMALAPTCAAKPWISSISPSLTSQWRYDHQPRVVLSGRHSRRERFKRSGNKLPGQRDLLQRRSEPHLMTLIALSWSWPSRRYVYWGEPVFWLATCWSITILLFQMETFIKNFFIISIVLCNEGFLSVCLFFRLTLLLSWILILNGGSNIIFKTDSIQSSSNTCKNY